MGDERERKEHEQAEENTRKHAAPDAGGLTEPFLITLNKSGNPKLGANTSNRKDSAHLIILGIKEGGLIAAWNAENPDKQVKPGHCIVRVNEVEGNKEALYSLIAREQELRMLIDPRGPQRNHPN